MTDYFLFRFTRPVASYKTGEIYIAPEQVVSSIRESFTRAGMMGTIEVERYSSILPYKCGDQSKYIIFMRDGALGDMFAMSPFINRMIREYPERIIKYITPPVYHAAFSWFYYNKQIRPSDATKPIFEETKIELKNFIKAVRRVDTGAEVETGSRENWLSVYSRGTGIELDELRPSLNIDMVPAEPSIYRKGVKSILVVPRATAVNRSIEFNTIYKALAEIYGTRTDVEFYVHLRNITTDDMNEIIRVDDNRVQVIQPRDVHHFLGDLFHADQVISVDTAALHFREGVRRPAIGLYASFDAASRTSGYKFTRSFNLQTTCPHAPCHTHGAALTHDVCKIGSSVMKYAPCLSNIASPKLHDQLVEILKPYLI